MRAVGSYHLTLITLIPVSTTRNRLKANDKMALDLFFCIKNTFGHGTRIFIDLVNVLHSADQKYKK